MTVSEIDKELAKRIIKEKENIIVSNLSEITHFGDIWLKGLKFEMLKLIIS